MDAETRPSADPLFRNDVLAGLAAPVRAVPARWLYDRRGSELFEAITGLPEYYLTRVETTLLEDHCGAVARIVGPGAAVIEFGSGASIKTRILLRAAEPPLYVPIDISGEFLRDAATALANEFPGLAIRPVEADFMQPIALPPEVRDRRRLGFFPGSTIGNMVASTAVDLLRAMKNSLGVGAHLLIGVDRIKDVDVLTRAYDDAAGVTAAFNLNLLDRINRELDADIPVDAFRHRAVWNDPMSRIEMHLEAMRDIAFTVDGADFEMKAGETIHTENSHKYGPRDARLLLRASGWGLVKEWTDPKDRYALILAEAEAVRHAP
ncbi:L-histidine N(alpha)-methyltransferase [Sphingosinicella rhizophila]|uniref:L-histidine N(Alpha)-methyltransferase n=1 Tax=Sphingosinicella rhizophila TaxID=3050082 RepID=A0ABU3Q7T8_9SPHN|nr:L-histidine N(alpha)-methyltransferase [Sphingosinicella sp. GR2756]MDT9599466.1 L-histidine N(alpha)-methyltransferase [Sphingosinicella sp. GR2756]